MNIEIVGNGSFGSFLTHLLYPHCNIRQGADTVILAVPFQAYNEVAEKHRGKHLINVCSIQGPSTNVLLNYSDRVTGLHPLFGKRTPEPNRVTIITRVKDEKFPNDDEFLNFWMRYVNSAIKGMTADEHDQLMARTHGVVVRVAQYAASQITEQDNVFIPHSYRLLLEFVKTLEDMPKGTLDSILANPHLQ